MSISILLANHHAVLRRGLRVALDKESGFKVVAEADNGQQTVDLALGQTPEVVVMDSHMPGLNGMEAIRRIKAALPQVKMLALSMYADRRHVIDMLEAGASGYILKNSPFPELVSAIRALAAGKTYLCADVAGLVVEMAMHPQDGRDTGSLALLSSREIEIAQMVAEGNTNKVIARHLRVAESTVESHRRQIMKKLDLKNLPQLVKLAIREGLIPLE